jgi:hypothetical protein
MSLCFASAIRSGLLFAFATRGITVSFRVGPPSLLPRLAIQEGILSGTSSEDKWYIAAKDKAFCSLPEEGT